MTIGGQPVSMKTWTGADDNIVVTQIRSLGSHTVRLQARTSTGSVDARGGLTSTSGVSGDSVWATRTTPAAPRWTTRASLATRVGGGQVVGSPTANGPAGQIVFDLPAGETVNIVTGVAGGGQNPADPAPAALALAGAQTGATVDALYDAHLDWWKRYWLKSYVDLGDDVLEKFYYGQLYLLGSSLREGKTASGLYGIWATSDFPQWGGDMHLNYNWQAKLLLTKTIEASELLKADKEKRPVWKQILKHLSPAPTTVHNGKTVFALADPGTVSDGRDIRPGDNTINLEFIHPGEQMGITSPEADRQIAIDTIDAMNSWGQENSFPKIFLQAARVGYPAQTLIDRLKTQINNRMAGNLRITDGNHGLEKAGTIEAVNNMLVQSFDGTVKVFPVWPAGKDGSFVKLREKGGLVISSEISAGRVTYVDITSEAGGDVKLVNPWGQKVRIIRVGTKQVSYDSGNTIEFSTKEGSTYNITPI